MFGNYGTDNISSTSTIGGFINLGKAFLSTDSSAYHLLNFTAQISSSDATLNHDALMNIINNLAAPDDTACTDATLKLDTVSYGRLSAEDIAIATAKNWSIISR